MYQGFAKDDGAVIGPVTSETVAVTFLETSDTAGGEESIVYIEEDENGAETLAVAAAKINPLTGGTFEWYKADYLASMKRTVAMSQMSSMLNDTCRNSMYISAITKCIEYFTNKTGKQPTVLDVGSGTGLLSMSAARNGAKNVIGCEMFQAMAALSEDVIEANELHNKIAIFPDKSSNLCEEHLIAIHQAFNGEGDSDDYKPHILISEILDSALLGESCIISHADAIDRLVQADDKSLPPLSERIIPHSAQVYAHLVDCETVSSMVDISSIKLDGATAWKFRGSEKCCGGWPLLPVHWDIYEENYNGKCISSPTPRGDGMGSNTGAPTPILTVNFCSGSKQECDGEGENPARSTAVYAVQDGTVNGVLLWWKVRLLSPDIDPEGSCVLHTAPRVVVEQVNRGNVQVEGLQSLPELNWQDHWLQVVYPLPKRISVTSGQKLQINACHDSIHIWLDVVRLDAVISNNSSSSELPMACSELVACGTLSPKRPRCEVVSLKETCPEEQSCLCGWHMLHGSERIQALNDDQRRMDAWKKVLKLLVEQLVESLSADPTRKDFIFDATDGSVLSILAGQYIKAGANGGGIGSAVAGFSSSSPKIVSLESKHFSNIFYSQLTHANNLDEILLVLDDDGDYSPIADFLGNPSGTAELGASESCEVDEELDDEKLLSLQDMMDQHPDMKIGCLISECYYYQMHIQPTWSALSFYYRRVQLDGLLRKAGDGSSVIAPYRAKIMAAAFELPDLRKSHGYVGMVNDAYDHSMYDAYIHNWDNEYLYPYKLGNFRKKLLTEPSCIATLDYYLPLAQLLEHIQSKENIGKDMDLVELNRIPSGFSNTVMLPVVNQGRCDAVAIWVDYQLTSSDIDGGNVLESYRTTFHDKHDFPLYATQYVKFFAAPSGLTTDSIVTSNIQFSHGDTDFKYKFTTTV